MELARSGSPQRKSPVGNSPKLVQICEYRKPDIKKYWVFIKSICDCGAPCFFFLCFCMSGCVFGVPQISEHRKLEYRKLMIGSFRCLIWGRRFFFCGLVLLGRLRAFRGHLQGSLGGVCRLCTREGGSECAFMLWLTSVFRPEEQERGSLILVWQFWVD